MKRGKMITEKQLKANRMNSKLGRVKSEQGKIKSKKNSLKHGIFSNEILLDGDFQENPQEFEEIKNNVYETYEPEGIVEEFCAQRIIYGIWRMKRVARAEKGIIQGLTSSYISDKETKRLNDTKGIFDRIPTLDEAFTESNPKLIDRAIELFQFATNEFEYRGSLSPVSQRRISTYFFKSNNTWADEEFTEANSRLNPFVEGSLFDKSSEEEKAAAKTIVSDYLNQEIDTLKKSLAETEKRIKNIDTANLFSLLIPNQFDLERLQRYETTIENQIYRAIDELKRHQATRKN